MQQTWVGRCDHFLRLLVYGACHAAPGTDPQFPTRRSWPF
jgi:hypothetical protein